MLCGRKENRRYMHGNSQVLPTSLYAVYSSMYGPQKGDEHALRMWWHLPTKQIVLYASLRPANVFVLAPSKGSIVPRVVLSPALVMHASVGRRMKTLIQIH